MFTMLGMAVCSAALFGFISAKKTAAGNTEEYAIMWVEEAGLDMGIITAIGNNYPTYQRIKAFNKEKAKSPDSYSMDYSCITGSMGKLNGQGFELVSSTYDATYRRTVFVFRKKL